MSNEKIGRRLVLQSLATGAGVAAFATGASAAGHAHHAAAAAAPAVPATAGASHLAFLDQHSFDTLAVLSEQIVPGARNAKVAEFLDGLLAVEKTETQRRFTQALGAFEGAARAAHAKPWKALTTEQANAVLTTMSGAPDSEGVKQAFEDIKRSVVDAYYTSEVGMKDLGWDGSVAFAPPGACG